MIQLPAPIEAAEHDAQRTEGHYYETKIAFQVWSGDRRLLVRSASAPDAPFAPLAAGYSDQAYENVKWRVFTLPSGSLWIQVAERSDIRTELSEKLAFAAAEPLVIGIPVLLLLLGLLIGYGLAPLGKLAQQIETRQADALTPVSLPRVPAEIRPVLDALNGLLGRLTSALERERRLHRRRRARAAHAARGAEGARAERRARRQPGRTAGFARPHAGRARPHHPPRRADARVQPRGGVRGATRAQAGVAAPGPSPAKRSRRCSRASARAGSR